MTVTWTPSTASSSLPSRKSSPPPETPPNASAERAGSRGPRAPRSPYQYDEGKQTPTAFQADHRQYQLAAAWKRTAQDFVPAGLPSYRPATEADADAWFLNQIRQGRDPVDHPANARYPGTPEARLARLQSGGLVEDRQSEQKLTASGEAELKRLRGESARPAQLPYVVRTGPMASVSQVRNDADLWAAIKDRGVRKILAVEMEAATIATAAFQRELRWLVVKGVMDHANLEKNDSVKEFAARASAEVMFRMLAAFRPARAGRTGPVPVPGQAKLTVIRKLLGDWNDLADRLGLEQYDKFRFTAGNQPRELWEWLERRDQLGGHVRVSCFRRGPCPLPSRISARAGKILPITSRSRRS
jgi:hypothetical protein